MVVEKRFEQSTCEPNGLQILAPQIRLDPTQRWILNNFVVFILMLPCIELWSANRQSICQSFLI